MIIEICKHTAQKRVVGSREEFYTHLRNLGASHNEAVIGRNAREYETQHCWFREAHEDINLWAPRVPLGRKLVTRA